MGKSQSKEKRKEYYLKNYAAIYARGRAYKAANPEKNKAWARKYNETHREEHRIRSRANSIKRKQVILDHYGNKCACCSENRIEFLSVDHINNDGAKHRKEIGTNLYFWLAKNGFPKDGYQILCMNCNFAKKGVNKVCPHETERKLSTSRQNSGPPVHS